ncbi:hypothetical protein [Streptomyces sp. HUAS ZL42]|uniref:hypothetical protein n=1 Tax=Streptomyces sp. HUAS ZL42 TaxID=3231715 RepID=UPI00345E330C
MSEILSGGPERPPWKPPRWLIVTVVASVMIAALVVSFIAVSGEDTQQSAGPRRSPSPSTAGIPFADGPDASVRQDETPGLVIKGVALNQGSLNRHDRTANAGPWTVTVRRADGSLARNGAVVTFPVARPRDGRPIRIGGVAGWDRDGEIVWPLAGSYARVRGDLPQSQLAAIAVATTAASGRPVVKPPSGLSVVSTGTSRPHVLREARYGSDDVGEAEELSYGLIFTGVARCGGIEELLYARQAQTSGTVHGKPAVVTTALGGNGALAWEPAPGVVAYVGYSGASLDRGAVTALHRLAELGRLLSPQQWQDTGPQTFDQVNNFD